MSTESMKQQSASRDHVQKYLRRSAELKDEVAANCVDSIVAAATLIADTFRAGRKVLLCGNGGSAADCQHMAAEFVGVLNKDFQRAGLPAIALTTDTSFLTAYSNDFGFESVFEHQVETLGNSGDLLIGISTSGNSANVMRAIKAARVRGLQTVALIGREGSLAALADVVVAVPSDETQHIQEAHLAIEHVICELVEQMLFKQTQ